MKSIRLEAEGCIYSIYPIKFCYCYFSNEIYPAWDRVMYLLILKSQFNETYPAWGQVMYLFNETHPASGRVMYLLPKNIFNEIHPASSRIWYLLPKSPFNLRRFCDNYILNQTHPDWGRLIYLLLNWSIYHKILDISQWNPPGLRPGADSLRH